MAVNLITYDAQRHKVARPVTSREEYLSLRDSEAQQRNVAEARKGNEAAKHALVQFNYSLASPKVWRKSALVSVPDAEESVEKPTFPLRGATTIGNSVGMDVDFDKSADDYAEKMAKAPELILQKKDELGLLMLERSATKGYHLVFKRHADMTNEENLQWASDLLGVEFDKGAKDITRVFFTTTASAEDMLYLDDEIFITDIVAQDANNATQKVGEKPIKVSSPTYPSKLALDPLIDEKLEKATVQNLTAFDLCVKEAGLDPEQMDVWGEHNWHNNLMAVLSVGLPKLMSREQLMAVVKERLPNYSGTEDCQKTIKYFYDNYAADMGFMSVTLREINAKAQEAPSQPPRGEETDDEGEKELEEITATWEPPQMPKKLPRLVELELRNYDPRFREALAVSATVGHAGIASHFRTTYLSGKVISPASMVAIIGTSGSGKDNCTNLFNDQIQYTLQASDEQEWEKVRVNAEMREKMEKAKDRPVKYHPKICLFEGASKTSLLELQTNLGKNGMLVGIYSEVDGFVGASSAAWSNISVLLRKGWGGEMHRQFFMSDATCNTYTTMNISLLMEGTPQAMLGRMFNDKNTENGLMQRFMPVLMPKQKRTFRPPKMYFLSDDEMHERDALLMELYQKNLSLGDDTCLLDMPKMTKAIERWYDELEELYNEGNLTEAEADLSHRCGEFMMRTALPLVPLYGESKEVIDYSVWVGKDAFYNMCRIYGHRVQKDLANAQELLADHSDGRKTAEPLLDKMPDVFTVQQFKEQRVKDGQSPEVRMLLSRYCKKGKIEKISKGVYRKM